ncbi:MAG TPA: TolC family protein [Isosphaeraceae bacterium]|jgi:cobalt-zinc-cadmium efflux system outer membrane protein|nr:TolC family protein [Isosphaeraceae bacterium]
MRRLRAATLVTIATTGALWGRPDAGRAADGPAAAVPGRAARRDAPRAAVVPAPSSLKDLEALALANNPTIRAAEALVQQQQGLLRQLTRYPNPTAGWVQSTSSPRAQGATQGAFLSQDYVTAGKLRLAGRAERAEIEMRCWQLRAQIGRVVNDVRIRYFEVLGAQQAIGAAAELERLAAEDLQSVRQLLEAKQLSRPDLIQAEVHLEAVRASLREAQLHHQAAWRQLANLVGVPGLPPAPLSGDVEADVPRLDWQESLRGLLAESPVLRAQSAQIREATAEVELQKRLVIPNINTQLVIQRDYVKGFNQVSTLVSAPIPLFNRNRGNILNAQATLRQQQQEYRRLQLALADQLAASFQQYLSARNQVEHLRNILPRTRENIALTTQAFKAGQSGFDYMRVRDAEESYHQTKTSYIDALTALRRSALEIAGLELTGGLNPTEIGTALQATPGVPAGLGGVLLQLQQQQSSGVRATLPGALQSTLTGPQ